MSVEVNIIRKADLWTVTENGATVFETDYSTLKGLREFLRQTPERREACNRFIRNFEAELKKAVTPA